MFSGSISSSREPILEITIASVSNLERSLTFDAVVDTGFTDFLTISSDVAKHLALPSKGYGYATLADGSEIETPIVVGAVLWHDSIWRTVPITVTEGGPLVGMSLLYGSRVTLDAIDGGSLSISPLS